MNIMFDPVKVIGTVCSANASVMKHDMRIKYVFIANLSEITGPNNAVREQYQPKFLKISTEKALCM